MKPKYKVMKTANYRGEDSADVVFECEAGFMFVCDCGDWNNEQAQNHAKLICELLNRELNK